MNEQKPLVSFILTYYNLPVPMLCECINSILALSLQPSEREIIVVDDGSDTSPMNGLMQYGDTIIYVRQKNQGLSVARNTGIDLSNGEYIQFVDTDDYLIKTAYDHSLDIVRQNNQIDMLLFDFTSNDSLAATFHDSPFTSGTNYMLHNNIHGTAWGYIFKKSTMGELRFTPGIWHEDEEFTPLLLIRAEVVCVTDAKAYYYRKRANSIMTTTDDKSSAKRLKDFLGVISRLKDKCSYLPQNDKIALQRRVAQLSMDYIYNAILLTHSYNHVMDCVKELYDAGLYPLPKHNYSTKYVWFRRLANSKAGLRILLHTMPHLKREK